MHLYHNYLGEIYGRQRSETGAIDVRICPLCLFLVILGMLVKKKKKKTAGFFAIVATQMLKPHNTSLKNIELFFPLYFTSNLRVNLETDN